MKNTYNWYSPNDTTALPDLVHQTLTYGTLKDIKTLKSEIGTERLKNIFIQYPKKLYSPASLNFISKYILKVTTSFYEDAYLKSTSRNI